MSYTIHHGDVLDVLRGMPDESVYCCVTSPPYWGLRDYGTGQWSGGDTDCDHRKVIDSQKAVATSTLRGGKKSTGHLQEGYKGECARCGAVRIDSQIGIESTPEAYVSKLLEVFREVRRVLRADGTLWLNLGDSYAGSFGAQSKREAEGIQAINLQRFGNGKSATRKPSEWGMGLKPKDLIGIPWRVALALQADGWYLRSDIIWAKKAPMPESVKDRCTRSHEYIFHLAKSERYYYNAEAIAESAVNPTYGKFTDNGRDKQRGHSRRHAGFNGRYAAKIAAEGVPDTRNKRDVWELPPMGVPDAHFATFPIELPETCIRAGCPIDGVVLDPFAGSGTTGLAALKNGRRFVGIELNAEYIAIARTRLMRHYPLLADFTEASA